jgi:hypothetical protein
MSIEELASVAVKHKGHLEQAEYFIDFQKLQQDLSQKINGLVPIPHIQQSI